MKPPPFAYARAESLDHALTLLDEAGEDAKVLAGGQSLVPLLAYRLARPTHLIDIGRLPGLDTMRSDDTGLVVGGLVRHHELERSAGLSGPWRVLREAAGLIGHHPIRIRGTFAGSVAHADPAAELPVAATALDASFTVRSTGGDRVIPAAEFFVGPFMTVLEPAEIVVDGRFPAPPAGMRSAFAEFSPRAGDFAFVSVAVAVALDDGDRVRHARIVLGCVGALPLRASEAEDELMGSALTEQVIDDAARAAAAGCDPVDGPHASATFRRELVAVLVGRTLRRLREDHP